MASKAAKCASEEAGSQRQLGGPQGEGGGGSKRNLIHIVVPPMGLLPKSSYKML